MSDDEQKFNSAANELKAFMDAWDKAKIEVDFAQKGFYVNSTHQKRHVLVESGRDCFRVARKS